MGRRQYVFKLWLLDVGNIITAISPTTVRSCGNLLYRLPSATGSQSCSPVVNHKELLKARCLLVVYRKKTIVEPENSWGWKGTLEIVWSNLLFRADLTSKLGHVTFLLFFIFLVYILFMCIVFYIYNVYYIGPWSRKI